MHIPIKVDYGVRALVYLAEQGGEELVHANEIARRTAIPEPYLEQVLHTLGRRGFIRSQRGPQGGHTLALDPSEIRLSMVMTCLGVTETMVGCLGNETACVHVPACAQREVWRSVEEAIHRILDSTSIADLVERTRAIKRARVAAAAPVRLKPAPV